MGKTNRCQESGLQKNPSNKPFWWRKEPLKHTSFLCVCKPKLRIVVGKKLKKKIETNPGSWHVFFLLQGSVLVQQCCTGIIEKLWQRTSDEKEMTTPLARSGPAAGRKGPQIVAEPQNTKQKDGSCIRWNATEAFSFKKKGSLSW
jgi:hypothetical protein